MAFKYRRMLPSLKALRRLMKTGDHRLYRQGLQKNWHKGVAPVEGVPIRYVAKAYTYVARQLNS